MSYTKADPNAVNSESDMGLPVAASREQQSHGQQQQRSQTQEAARVPKETYMTVGSNGAPQFLPPEKRCEPDQLASKKNEGMSIYEQYRTPSKEELQKAYAMPLLDDHRNALLFGDIVKPQKSATGRRIIIFIRHFYCGNCQDYVRTLSREMSPEQLERQSPGTTLAIIGCGNPDLIPIYKQATGCKFEIYTDPKRSIQKQLGFAFNFVAGAKAKYKRRGPIMQLLIDGLGMFMHPKSLFGYGGAMNQNGGEFIWSDNQLRFAHRMPNFTGHLEVDELWDVLLTRT